MAVARQYTTSAPAGTVTGSSRTRLVLAEGSAVTGPTVSLSVILLGIVTVLVGGWGAAAPFAGPDFGFAADRYTAWQWSETSLFLALIPGAVAFVCGLWVLAAATRPSYGRRPDLWLLGLIVAACGAWFVVGQYVWRALGKRAFIVPSGPTHFMWKELCFAVGPGVILVLCGALFMGWAVRRQLAVVAERTTRTVESPGVVAPVAEPVVPVATTAAPTGTMAPPPPVTTEQPVVERPVTAQQPVVERPVTAQPPVVERPVATGQPVVGETVTGQPVVERPTTVVEHPVAGEPGVVTSRPAHAAGEPMVVERPVSGQRPVTEPTGRPLP